MAYMRSLDEQNQQQTQQGQQSAPVSSFSGGQTISPEPGKVASSGTSANGQPQNGTSSGSWTNISDFLSANPSMGQKAIDQGNSLLGKEGTLWNQASDPTRTATKNFSYESMTPDEIDAAIRMGSTDKLKKTLQQPAFTGPTTINYDINGSGNVTDAKQLSNRNTATNVLAKDAIKAGGYGLGLRTLDTSLLGADPTYAQGAPKLWNNVNDFVSKTGQDKSQLEGLAKYDQDKVESSRKAVGDELSTEKNKYTTDVDNLLKSKQAQADWAKKGYANAYQQWYDNVYLPKQQANASAAQHGKPLAGYSASDMFGYSPISNYEAGATTGNVGTDEDYSALANIADVLGEKPVYSRAGTYSLPSYTKDNGQEAISDWLASQAGQSAQMGSPLPINIGNNSAANAILGAGNIETPEQLYKRLGITP